MVNGIAFIEDTAGLDWSGTPLRLSLRTLKCATFWVMLVQSGMQASTKNNMYG